MIEESCYMCSELANSREHCPPLCLFPESKDVEGLNFRNNLITVPSCEEHNSKKSKDDEFLMLAIASIVGNNSLGYRQTRTKVNRALRRKSADFLGKAIMRNLKSGSVKSVNGYEFPVLFGNPDHERFIKCFEHIACGVYYHEYGKRFEGKVDILLGFIEYSKKDNQKFLEFVRKRFELEELRLEVKGKNPQVFTYQFCAPDEHGLIGFKLVFYGGTEVFGSFTPSGTEIPFDLANEIMTAGMPITYTLGEEEFHFNQNVQDMDNFGRSNS